MFFKFLEGNEFFFVWNNFKIQSMWSIDQDAVSRCCLLGSNTNKSKCKTHVIISHWFMWWTLSYKQWVQILWCATIWELVTLMWKHWIGCLDIEGLTTLWCSWQWWTIPTWMKMIQATNNTNNKNFDSSSLDQVKGHFVDSDIFFIWFTKSEHENVRIIIWFLSNLTQFWGLKTESAIKN